MNGKCMLRVACGVLGISCVASLQAAMVTINPSKDTTIFQNNVNNSYGGGAMIFAGTNTAVSPRRGIMQFDVASNVPTGATIMSVQLSMVLAQVAGSGMGGGGGTYSIGLYDASADWGEGTVSTGSGQGGAAGPGDATWNARHYSATSPVLWTSPGGDFSGAASQTASVGTSVGSTYTWTSNAAMVSDVQSWLDSPSNNFGWFLMNANESDAQTFRAFDTRETTSPPQLQIIYTVPEPSAVLAGACLLSLLRRRKLE